MYVGTMVTTALVSTNLTLVGSTFERVELCRGLSQIVRRSRFVRTGVAELVAKIPSQTSDPVSDVSATASVHPTGRPAVEYTIVPNSRRSLAVVGPR